MSGNVEKTSVHAGSFDPRHAGSFDPRHAGSFDPRHAGSFDRRQYLLHVVYQDKKN